MPSLAYVYPRASYVASRYCFWRRLCVYLCVCASVHTKSRKLLIRNCHWCNLVAICPILNARSGWKLMTFDLDLWGFDLELFSYFFIYHIYLIHLSFECLNLATSFSACRYILRISRLMFSLHKTVNSQIFIRHMDRSTRKEKMKQWNKQKHMRAETTQITLANMNPVIVKKIQRLKCSIVTILLSVRVDTFWD